MKWDTLGSFRVNQNGVLVARFNDEIVQISKTEWDEYTSFVDRVIDRQGFGNNVDPEALSFAYNGFIFDFSPATWAHFRGCGNRAWQLWKEGLPICDECRAEVHASLPGHGHRRSPPCGQYTFTVNPEVIDFLKSQPKEATGAELREGWFEVLRKKGLL